MTHIRYTVAIVLLGMLIGCDELTLESAPTNQPPTVTLEADPVEGQAPLQVKFTATASDPDGDDLTYLWDRSRGSAFLGGNKLTHTFKSAGVYSVSVTVSDGEYQVTAQADVTVTAAPSHPPPTDPNPPQQQEPVPYGGEWVWEFRSQHGFTDEGTISIVKEDPDDDDWEGSWGRWQSCFAGNCFDQAEGVGFIGFAPVEHSGLQLVIVLFEENLAGDYRQIYVGLDGDMEVEQDGRGRNFLWGEGYYSRYSGGALFGDAYAVLTDHPLTFNKQVRHKPVELPRKPRIIRR